MTLNSTGLEALFNGIYDKRIDTRNLPVDYYQAVIDELTDDDDAFFDLPEYAKNKDKDLILFLSMFAAAKTYQLVRELETLTSLSKPEYLIAANKVFNRYEAWLATEKDTAQWSRVMAAKFEQLKKNNLYLKYVTAQDESVCLTCAPLNETVKGAEDEFWDTHLPPMHMRCRCDVVQTLDVPTDAPIVPVGDMFKNNVNKSANPFPNHPYFDVAPKDKAFARTNFGLPLPE